MQEIDDLRNISASVAGRVNAEPISNAVQYLMALADHYSALINFEFMRNLKPEDAKAQKMNVDDMQQTTLVLAGRYVNTREGFSPQLSRRLPVLREAAYNFYQRDNYLAYFSSLRAEVSKA